MSPALLTAFGRMAKKDVPKWFNKQHNQLQQCERESFKNTTTLPEVFAIFEGIAGKCPLTTDNERSTKAQVTHRRLFIAVALVLYDQVWMHHYTGRVRNGLRMSMAEALKVHETWISQTLEGVRFEYFHIDEFQMQVNLIAYCIRMQGKHLA